MDKIQDIISKVENLSALEISELVKALEEKFGVSAAMPVAAAGVATSGAAAEEKTAFAIVLKEAGGQKISVIKVVKEITGLGLKEAKDIVDGAPKTIKENVKKEDAEEMKKKLTEAGAVVELQ
jgi:large subunit ribosomal protein L7/L12